MIESARLTIGWIITKISEWILMKFCGGVAYDRRGNCSDFCGD